VGCDRISYFDRDESSGIILFPIYHQDTTMTTLHSQDLLLESIEKTARAYALLQSSLIRLSHADIESYRTAEDHEPMDAFIMRLERFVELVLSKLAKSIALYEQTAIDGTVRSVRNRIVHDYLENITLEIYHKTDTEYTRSFTFFENGIRAYIDRQRLQSPYFLASHL
jgi:hypothetical protein